MPVHARSGTDDGYRGAVPSVLSVNIARSAEPVPGRKAPSGIGKQPVDHAVEVRDPGPKKGGLGGGLVGDHVMERRHHGGSDQAVYAYARESLDWWESELGRRLPEGMFGENLTTLGVDVDNALIGERWRIGDSVVLQVTDARIPCATFRGRMGVRGWLRRFTEAERSGAYLRIVRGGAIRTSDRLEIVHRPAHGVTVALAFRALLRDRTLLPELLAAGDDLSDELRRFVARRAMRSSE
jgi:MOSC domain-containing protein YiiM